MNNKRSPSLNKIQGFQKLCARNEDKDQIYISYYIIILQRVQGKRLQDKSKECGIKAPQLSPNEGMTK